MWQRLCGFLVVFLLMFNGAILGQEKNTWNFSHQSKTIQQVSVSKEAGVKQWTYSPFLNYGKNSIFYFGPLYKKLPAEKGTWRMPAFSERYSFHLASAYYIRSLGIFCKSELQLDKLTPVPFRFRLGSLDYVNWMEQKPNAVKPNTAY